MTRSTSPARLAVVTGARRGIGLAMAEALAAAGADIIGVSAQLGPARRRGGRVIEPGRAFEGTRGRLRRPAMPSLALGAELAGTRTRHPGQQRGHDRAGARRASTHSTWWDRVLEVDLSSQFALTPAGRRGRCWSAAAAKSSSPRAC